jgi:hypothetical protein
MLDDGVFELPLKQRIAAIRKAKPVLEIPKPPKSPAGTAFKSVDEVRKMAASLLEYADKREVFEKEFTAAKKVYDEAQPLCASIEKQVTDLIFNDVGLSKLGLSEKKATKLWQKAWDGADNEDEAISNLRELVELFKD